MNRESILNRVSLAAIAALALLAARCGSSGSAAVGGGDAAAASGSGGGSGGSGADGGNGSSSGAGSSGSGSGAGNGSGSGGGGSSGGAGSGGGSGGGSGSSSGTTPDGGGPTGGSESVLQRGKDLYRSATFAEPGLTRAAVSTMAPDTTFNTNATFPANGNLQNPGTASVLYLEQGPASQGCPTGAAGCKATARAAGAGLFFGFPALGANPNIVAMDETTGLTVWTAHVTTGGDGIRGTPVIDPASRRLFAVTGNNPHLVHALSVDDGSEVTAGGWPLTVALSYTGPTPPGDPNGAAFTATFNSGQQNQHGALLLANNILYIPFGGEFGDGGSYLGWVVAVDITDPTHLAGWATTSPKSGIWGSGGLASDGTSVFAVTGNSSASQRSESDSEEVIRVTGLAQFTRSEANVYVPSAWSQWDGNDMDFGASTPAYVPLPSGSNPPSLLVAPAKLGALFILNGADLSAGNYPATGGELADLEVSDQNSQSVYTSPTIYTSASGLHAAINVGNKPKNCPAGTPAATTNSAEAIVSVLLKPGSTPIATEAWCAANSQGGGHTNYPPISTTSDGIGADALVWFVNGTQLEAVDGDTGETVVTTTGTGCDNVPSMGFPIAVKNRIVVAALGHLCSWSVNGQ